MRTSGILLLLLCLSLTGLKAQPSVTQQPNPTGNALSFIAVSDIHLDTSNKTTWEAAAAKITQMAQGNGASTKPSFILYLGDLPSTPTHAHPHK